MKTSMLYKRDNYGVCAVTCSCGWSAQVETRQYSVPAYSQLDAAIKAHEKRHERDERLLRMTT